MGGAQQGDGICRGGQPGSSDLTQWVPQERQEDSSRKHTRERLSLAMTLPLEKLESPCSALEAMPPSLKKRVTRKLVEVMDL